MKTFNLPKTFTVTRSTKANSDSAAVEQTITFVLADDFDDAALLDLITRPLVIASQSDDRSKANKKENPVAIPATKTVTVTKASARVVDPDRAIKEAVAKMLGVKVDEITAEQLTMAKTLLKGMCTNNEEHNEEENHNEG